MGKMKEKEVEQMAFVTGFAIGSMIGMLAVMLSMVWWIYGT